MSLRVYVKGYFPKISVKTSVHGYKTHTDWDY